MAATDSEGKQLTKISDLKHEMTVPEKRETLTPWLILGMAMHDLYGYTYKEVVDKIRGGKGESTLSKSAISPAGKRWRAKIADLVSSPEKLSKVLIQAASLDVTADFIMALEWAKDARDYRAVHSMTKDLLAVAGISGDEKKKPDAPTAVHIHLESKSLDIPAVEMDYEIVDEE